MSRIIGDQETTRFEYDASAAMSAELLRRGRLIDFDPAELSGWIEGEDGALYAFSAADVIDDRDIAIGQRVIFSGVGDLAFEVRGSSQAEAAVRSLQGRLIRYDADEYLGWIEGDDGGVYMFTAEDLIGESEIAVGQAVEFRGSEERAVEVRALAASGDAPAVQVPQQGQLLSYDTQELAGWISGADGNLYAFTAADVLGDSDIAVGQDVVFSAIGERAVDVHGADRSSEAVRALQGNLLNYDAQALIGWIKGEDGNLYAFTGAEIVGENEIEVGQAVDFTAVGERATDVRAMDQGHTDTQPRHGRLLGYDAAELCGWIEGDDSVVYTFTGADVLGEAELDVGQELDFSVAGERAMDVRATEVAGQPARPTSGTGILLSYSRQDLEGRIAGNDGNTYAFTAAELADGDELAVGEALAFSALGRRAIEVRSLDKKPKAASPPPSEPISLEVLSPAASLDQAGSRRSPSRIAAAAVLIALGTGAFALYRFLYGGTVGVLPDKAAQIGFAPAWTPPENAAIAFAPTDRVEQTEVGSTAVPGPEEETSSQGGVAAEIDFAPAWSPPEEPTAAGPTRSSEFSANPPSPITEAVTPAQEEANAVASAAPAADAPSTSRGKSRPALQPDPAKSDAWWSSSSASPGQLNLVYAGYLVDSPAIVLMFDGGFANAEAAERHVRVRRIDGSPVATKWRLGRSNRMLILPTLPGRYDVTVSKDFADASGRTVSARLEGPVMVR